MNIEFTYRYRDLGNFKNHGSVIFGNQKDLSVEKIDEVLINLTGENQTFVASRLKIPEMFFADFPYDPELDWEMHEYCGVSVTDLPINDILGRDIDDLIAQMKVIAE